MAIHGKRILITGGAGFIGSYLCEHLVEDNEVLVYDSYLRNAIRFSRASGHPHLREIHGDVLSPESVRAAVRGCQVVIHCAAVAGVYSVVKNSLVTMEVNLIGARNVFEAAVEHGVERFIHFSTSEVYGPFIHKGKEEDLSTIGPSGEARWVYAASKLASEHLAFAYAKEHHLSLTVVRPFNIYGPRQIGEGAIQQMIIRAISHQPIVLYKDGTQIRAWCFVEDFVDGVLRCLESSEAEGQTFNLGNPQGTITNLELARMIRRIAGSPSEIVFQEHPGPEVEVRVPSVAKAQDRLGYRPGVSLEEGIRRTIPWYREHHGELLA